MASEPLKSVLAGVGALVALRFLFSAYQFATFHFWRPSHPLTQYKRADGDAYALISGSSAGIGLGIGRALVHQGFGVILLGHLEDELASAAKALVVECPVAAARVRTLVLDCQAASPEEISAAVASISHLRVSILVNNVGSATLTSPPALRPLATLSIGEVDAHVDLNARFMARLTNRVLPLLTSSRTGSGSSSRERSLILNLSSVGRFGLPWLVMYGATKAFDYAFSLGLASELEGDPATAHVDCLAVVPGEVRSQSNAGAAPGLAPTADEFGRMVVTAVDTAVRRGWREIRPDWRHDLIVTMMERVLPAAWATHFVREDMRVKKATVEAEAKRR
jgi:17beta-estradiol 17-dehydrogenase / very-long-chain 3-oxoacyl-CoA reductase